MSKLLINEPPLQVLPTLAVKVGLNEAIFLQQLHYWLQITKHHREGKPWVYNRITDWQEQFPFWSIPTIRRIVNNLRRLGIIEATDEFNKMPIDKTLWYTIDYSSLPSDQPDHSNDENVTPSDQVDHSNDQIDQLEGSDCAPVSDQVDHSNNQRLPETTQETTDREKVVGASAPTPPDPSQKTEWELWLEALCWICHAHMDTTKLTSKDFDILTAEAKKIKKLGYAQPSLVKGWFTEHWQHDWRWKKDSQRPSAYQVRQLLPGYAETALEMEGLMETGIQHRNGAKPRPRAHPPPTYDDPWAIVVSETANQMPEGVLARAHAESIGDLSGAEVWEVSLAMRDASHLSWMQDRGKELIRKSLSSLLGGRAVKVDVIVPETERTE